MAELFTAATPFAVAVLAAILALLANGQIDRRRAKREYVTKMTEAFRDDVRKAVEEASDYWSTKPSTNKSVAEARIRMYEKDIRSASLFLELRSSRKEAGKLNSATNNFIGALTGADFEAAKVEPKSHHVVTVTSLGAVLRQEIAELRDEQIHKH